MIPNKEERKKKKRERRSGSVDDKLNYFQKVVQEVKANLPLLNLLGMQKHRKGNDKKKHREKERGSQLERETEITRKRRHGTGVKKIKPTILCRVCDEADRAVWGR